MQVYCTIKKRALVFTYIIQQLDFELSFCFFDLGILIGYILLQIYREGQTDFELTSWSLSLARDRHCAATLRLQLYYFLFSSD